MNSSLNEVPIFNEKNIKIGSVRKASKDGLDLYCLADVKRVLDLKNCSGLSTLCQNIVRPVGTRLCWATWPSIRKGLQRIAEPSFLVLHFIGRAHFEIPDPASIDIEFKKSILAKEIEKFPEEKQLEILLHLHDVVKSGSYFKNFVGDHFFELCTVKNLLEFSSLEFSKMISRLLAKNKEKSENAAKSLAIPIPDGGGAVNLTINLNFQAKGQK